MPHPYHPSNTSPPRSPPRSPPPHNRASPHAPTRDPHLAPHRNVNLAPDCAFDGLPTALPCQFREVFVRFVRWLSQTRHLPTGLALPRRGGFGFGPGTHLRVLHLGYGS